MNVKHKEYYIKVRIAYEDHNAFELREVFCKKDYTSSTPNSKYPLIDIIDEFYSKFNNCDIVDINIIGKHFKE
jgi:hypothetical protein